MSPALRAPVPSDYEAIASWVPDAETCIRWAGPRLPFPFSIAELPVLLAVAGGESYCLAHGEGSPVSFAQHWVPSPGIARVKP